MRLCIIYGIHIYLIICGDVNKSISNVKLVLTKISMKIICSTQMLTDCGVYKNINR